MKKTFEEIKENVKKLDREKVLKWALGGIALGATGTAIVLAGKNSSLSKKNKQQEITLQQKDSIVRVLEKEVKTLGRENSNLKYQLGKNAAEKIMGGRRHGR